MRRLFITTAVVLVASGTPTLAQGLDCEKAETPVELLICGDRELMRLDIKLSTLLKPRFDWLREQQKRCQIPATGEPPQEPQIWQWAPCLAESYRTQLRQLGQTEADPVQPTEAGFIHPLCLLGQPADVAACTQGFRHVPVKHTEARDWFQSGWSAVGGDWSAELTVEYYRIGAWKDGDVLRVDSVMEGGGQTYSIDVLDRSTGPLILAYFFDRTSGFAESDDVDDTITGVKVFEDGHLEVDRKVTPYGLIRFANLSESDSSDPFVSMEDLSVTETYYGTIHQTYSTKDQDGRVLSVSLGLKDPASGKFSIPTASQFHQNTPQQACFDTLFADPKEPLPRTLDAKAYDALVKTYIKTCVGKPK